MAGTFGAHVHVPTVGGQAGLCLDVIGQQGQTIAVLSHEEKGLMLVVSRWAGGKWIRLGMRRIKIEAWRIPGWHAITIKTERAGVRVRSCGQEIVVQRRDLGASTGRIGLVASSFASEPTTVEIRAFHAVAQ